MQQETLETLSSEQQPTSFGKFLGEVDVGTYVNQEIGDLEKYNILKNAFVPDRDFNFPFSIHYKNDKEIKCFLSVKHLTILLTG